MNNERRSIRAGFAVVEFTPAPGLSLFGQMHERRGERARDPLEACAAAFAPGDRGAAEAIPGNAGPPDARTVVLVSVDVCIMPNDFVAQVQARFEKQTGVPGSRLMLHATHTHVAPAAVSLLAAKADPTFLEHLEQAIVRAAGQAIRNLEPVELLAGAGGMENMGWNRRAMFSDGSSRMYGHSGQPGFVGMEGPRDPALPILVARRPGGQVSGVLVGFSTHPNAIENEIVYSADIPGEARRRLARCLGGDAVVVYLTGAAGNTAPSILDPYDERQPWRGEVGLVRSGLYLAGQAATVIASAMTPMLDPILKLEQRTLAIPLRPWPRPGDPAYPLPLENNDWPPATAYYQLAAAGWSDRVAGESPLAVKLSVLRLGDAAICTNPCELFVEYGLQIRQASGARVTLISQLTDGYAGYVPTTLAFQRGGYETWCAPTSQLVETAGDQITTATIEMLQAAFASAR
ncbi:MAG: hypothetical protein LC772_00150 [Chloroflexi bacterium]|nr:hypothetical protein [Chloroflexota bacterium]